MQIFLQRDVERVSRERWGSPEPYLVSLSYFSDQQLAWLLEDTGCIKGLSPEKFQFLVADRLDRLGLCVELTGDVNRKDGGVDLIACPKTGLPFLVAVPAKHHRTERKTRAPEVRDFQGVVPAQNTCFHLGILVTNTAFTSDARWIADNNKRLLRLRDLESLKRWLKNDFVNEFE